MVLLNNFQDIIDSLPQNVALNLPICKQNALEINFLNNGDETVYAGPAPLLPFANSGVFYASILSWRHLSAEHEECKAVYEVTFDTTDSNFSFKAGDTIGVIPQNDEVTVNFIVTHLGLASIADIPYTISVPSDQKGNKVPAHIPVKSTLRHVLTHCVDLRSVLKKTFLLALSRHTSDVNERRVLEYVCSKEGSKIYLSHILNTNLCLIDILKVFKSCKPSVSVLFANLPRLLPRPYSIVNSGIKDTNIIKICFSVMRLQNNRKGLTTGMLERIILNQQIKLEERMNNLNLKECVARKYEIPIYLRKNMSGFLLPNDIEKPLILIGPGTGVAPFIGFLEEREIIVKQNPGKVFGDVWLFFGSRNPKLDFIYEKELNDFMSGGILQKLCTAFSRVEDAEAKYIQDAMLQNCHDLTNLIASKASIYICGDAKNLPLQVKQTLHQCLMITGKSQAEAENAIVEMQKNKRYFVDAWS